MDNLPTWSGASVVYGRCQKLLEHMAKNGHVTQKKRGRRKFCVTSPDMDHVILAMNKGDEEQLKGILLESPFKYNFNPCS